ncbi:NYN domain-containing protein, partial [Corallococcus praedator]
MKTVLLIDGGAPRAWAQRRGLFFDADLVENLAHACVEDDEHLVRVLYYDCAPFDGVVEQPISKAQYVFRARHGFLDDVAKRERFAVRRGELA